MWTSKNRARYDRSKLRYPSDLTDDEWGLVEPLIPPGKSGGGKTRVVLRGEVNGLMYILWPGGPPHGLSPWRRKRIPLDREIGRAPIGDGWLIGPIFPHFRKCHSREERA